eukprot:883017_1
MTTLKVLGVAFIIINCCIICPFCVYYSLLYLKKAQNSSHRRVLQLRQPGTIKMNLFMICYFLLFEQTITLFETFNIIPSIPSIVSLCLALPTYCLVFYSGMIRSWLLYYDREIQSTVLQNQYASAHKSSHVKGHCGAVWFANHRHTLGNAKFLYALLLIVYIASIILLLICGYLVTDTGRGTYIYLAIAQWIIILTPTVLACVIMLASYLNRLLNPSQRTSKIMAQKRYARQYLHISFNTLRTLDKEIFLILLWTIVACLFRLIIAVSCNLIVMHVFEDDTSEMAIYSLWNHDTSQYTAIYVVDTVWAIFSVFMLHLIQTRRTLHIVSELNWFRSNNPIQSPPSHVRDLSRNSVSEDADEGGKSVHYMNPIIHVTGHNSEEDQESVVLLPSSDKHLETDAKSHCKKWEYEHIATKEPDELDEDDCDIAQEEACVAEPTTNKRWNQIKLNIFGKNRSKTKERSGSYEEDNGMIQKAKTENDLLKPEAKPKKSGFKILSKFGKAKSDNVEVMNRRLEVPLHDIISNRYGYDTFMKHLAKEYSTENLSFLTEVTQFKHRFCMELLHDVQRIYHAQVIRSNTSKDGIESIAQSLHQYPPKNTLHMNHSNTINKMKKQLELEHHSRMVHAYEYSIKYGWNLRLYETIPLTEILTEDHWRSFYSKAHKLYKKYIEPGSDSEINISYQCRNCVTKYFNNYANQSTVIHRPLSNTKQSSDLHSERDVFATDTCSVDGSYHHSQDDLSRFKRKNSTSSIVDDGFRLKKSRSFHNVFEADKLYLEEEDDDEDEKKGAIMHYGHHTPRKRRNDHKCRIKLHDISNTKNILDRLDEKVFLLQLFDDAAEEIYSVLKRDSLHRFYATETYTNAFLTKYVQRIRRSNGDITDLDACNTSDIDQGEKDVNIIFYYYCACKRRDKVCVSQCECEEKYLTREPFKAKLKRMKRKGTKRKKPLWSSSKPCSKNKNKNDEDLKIKITRQKAVDVNYWSALSTPIVDPSPAISISRRPTRGNSTMLRQSPHHSHTQTGMNWKLEHTQMMDTENGYYYDDMMVDNSQNVWEYNHKGVPIVRIINVNVVSNACLPDSIDASASSSPRTPIFHRSHAAYSSGTPRTRKTRSLQR